MTDFESVYSLYFREVYRYALSLCRNEEMAEEITQETFYKALSKVSSFDGKCKVSVWLCQIAKNSYYTYVKKNNRTKQIDEYELQELQDFVPGVAEEYDRRSDAERIQMILHNVRPPYKEVFMWRVYAELSFKQIGQIFGKTENWACVTYHRARKMIKERLEEKHGEN